MRNIFNDIKLSEKELEFFCKCEDCYVIRKREDDKYEDIDGRVFVLESEPKLSTVE